ncbi:MAG: hypothetical protein ABII90_07555 [Bacteroidota bacterium]
MLFKYQFLSYNHPIWNFPKVLNFWKVGNGIRFTLLCWGLLFSTSCFAQTNISIYPVQPPGYLVHYQDLWNVNIIVDPVNSSAWYFLEITISDNKSLTFWKARSYTFRITTSPYWITSGNIPDLEPVDVIFSHEAWYEKMTVTGGLFPPGEYLITYRLIQTVYDCTTTGKLVAVASYLKSIRMMYPPTLLFPFDNDTIKAEPVIFTWVPPFPLYPGQTITYGLRITEVLEGQKPIPAITANFLFFSTEEIEFTQFAYPGDARPLTPGLRYAWQVVAFNSRNITGYSPVWSFVVSEQLPEDKYIGKPSMWISLSEEPGMQFYNIDSETLSFKYYETYNDADASLNYSICDAADNSRVLSGKTDPLSVAKGYNAYGIDISGLNPGNYSLVVKNEKNKKYYLRFRRQKRD